MGHVRLDMIEGDGPTPVESLAPAGVTNAPTIENDDFRVTYDLAAGVISSIYDKRAERELVNQTAYAGLNQYVYDTYSTAPYVNHLSGHIEDSGDLELLAGRAVGTGATLIRAERTAVGERLEIALEGAGTDGIRTTIALPRGVRRVEIGNQIAKLESAAKESVFFAFPFAVAGARAHWELVGGVGGSAAPTVPGAPTHNQPIRHWAVVENGDHAVGWGTMEATLTMFGDIHLPYLPYPGTLRPHPVEPATVYSWALNNIWDTNFPAQQKGDTTFRYAITSSVHEADTNPREIGPRAAEGLTDPFVAVHLTGTAAETGAAEQTYVDSSHPLVGVSSVAGSRSGHDAVIYLRSVAAETVETDVRVGFGMRAAYVGTSLERDLAELSITAGTVRVRVPAGGLVAVVLDRA